MGTKRIPFNQVIQTHHITYNPPRTVKIRQTEHFLLTTLQRMKVPTKGFVIALKQYLKDNHNKAVSISQIKKENKMAGEHRGCKTTEAVAEKYHAVCPYKSCGHNNILASVTKGDIFKCENCRKDIKIRKVIAK